MKCDKCAFGKVMPDPDPYDSFNYDDCKIMCMKARVPREVAGALRPYEVKIISAPTWCPLDHITVEVITLFESALYQGATSRGDGHYYLKKVDAESHSKLHYRNCTTPIEHSAFHAGNGKYYILELESPVTLSSTVEETKKLREKALKKLSPEEIKILGL